MRLHSTELNTALAILIAFGVTQGCGEDPESTGEPGSGYDAGGYAVTGGGTTLPTGGTTGGVLQNSGGTTGGIKNSTGGGGTGGSTGGTSSAKGGSGGGGTLGMGGGGKGIGGASGGRASSGGRSSGGGGSGGKAAGGTGGGSTATFASVATVIQNKCGGCHSTSARMPVLKNDANLRTTLTSYKVARCGNNPMVTPMDTSKSALVGVVSKSCMGLAMPTPCNTTPCIPSTDLMTIQNWILAGAPP